MKRMLFTCASEDNCFVMHYYAAPFAEGLSALRHDKSKPIAAEILAKIRMLEPTFKYHDFWVAERYVYLSQGGILLTSGNHRQNKELEYLDNRIVKELQERAERDPDKAIKSGVLLLSGQLKAKIPVTSFSEEPETLFLYRKNAKRYGEFLREHKISYFYISDNSMRLKGVHTMIPMPGVGNNTDEMFLSVDFKIEGCRFREKHKKPVSVALTDHLFPFPHIGTGKFMHEPMVCGVHKFKSPREMYDYLNAYNP